jgi:hypothetical protein
MSRLRGSRGKAFAGARSASERRPDYQADRKRRREFVRQHLHDHGERMSDSTWKASCQCCGKVKTLPFSDWWADHVHAVAQGGSEHGDLRLSCKECQLRQGSAVGNARNPMAVSRKRKGERHPGDLS